VIENDDDNYKISLAEALDLMMEAWKSVSADTIQKCFRSITAGIDLTEDLAALDNTISKITVKLGGVVTGILYLQVDQNLDTCQEMGDDDLVEELKKSLAGEVEQDSEDEEKPSHIPVSEAVKAVQMLSCFVRFIVSDLKEKITKLNFSQTIYRQISWSRVTSHVIMTSCRKDLRSR